MYWSIKEAGVLNLQFGFRIWESQSDSTPEDAGDTAEVQYTFWDFGIEKPVSEVIVSDEDDECGEDCNKE